MTLEALALQYMSAWSVVFARVGTAAIFLPGMGERFVPARVRFAASFALSLPLIWLGDFVDHFEEFGEWVSLVFSETLTGAAFGLAIRLFLFGLQSAGSIAAQSSSMAQVFGAQSVEPLPAIGHLLAFGGLSLIMGLGFGERLLACFAKSYQLVPVGGGMSGQSLAEWGLGVVVWTFEIGFVLSAPFMLISLIYNLTIGFINKAMPQLMVSFVGAPLIVFLSLSLLAIVSVEILELWRDLLFGFLENPASVNP